ncbi:MAG: xanthine dehydrogenase family protein molybdopterin-binding subunit [Planctomycetota bacterium]|jgi:4-hydroxybenzoyl-CoA reductase alpha subunit
MSSPSDRPFLVVGRRVRKVGSRARTTGEAKYTDDLRFPDELVAKVLRSPHAHARILDVDLGPALAMPGVHAAIGGRDLPRTFGILGWTRDEPSLAVDKATYRGEGVAAVCAEDLRTAEAALEAIVVSYEPLAPILGIEDALTEGAEAIRTGAKKGNLSKNVKLSFGDVEKGFAEADAIAEGEFLFENTNHVAIEPHAVIARFDKDGLLTLWSSTQVPHYLQRELADVLEVPQSRIRVIVPPVGAGFGGKSEPMAHEFVAAKLSMMTGRPVRLRLTREEVFYAHRGRHPMRMRIEVGGKKDGRVTSVRLKTEIDGGAYSTYGVVTTYYSGQLLTAPVRMDAYEFDATRFFSTKPACGAKRGHGSVQPRFAYEVALDELAEKLSLDPIELRRRNCIGENVETINGQWIGSNGFLECLDAVEEASGWKERFGKLPYGRGLGVAASMYITGTNYPIYPNEMPQSAVVLRADRSGRVTVHCGATDIGQGSDTMLALVVAEVLGLDPADIAVVTQDTDLCPVDLGSYSSRVTYMCGTAAIEAAEKLRDKLFGAVADDWGCPTKDLAAYGSEIKHAIDPEKSMTFSQAVWIAEARFGSLVTSGDYLTKQRGGDYRGGTIGASPAYSFTVHVAEAEVDHETGLVRVPRVWAAHDCGRALNPMIVEGQVEGSVYMGLGEALLERQGYDERGHHLGPNLLDYKIPTALDTPEIHVSVIEKPDPEGPFGAKEAGEGPLHPIIPAVSNAIHDAVGVRLRTIPFHPANVLAAIRGKEGE